MPRQHFSVIFLSHFVFSFFKLSDFFFILLYLQYRTCVCFHNFPRLSTMFFSFFHSIPPRFSFIFLEKDTYTRSYPHCPHIFIPTIVTNLVLYELCELFSFFLYPIVFSIFCVRIVVGNRIFCKQYESCSVFISLILHFKIVTNITDCQYPVKELIVCVLLFLQETSILPRD